MEAEATQISIDWVNNFLGLKSHDREVAGKPMESKQFEITGIERVVSDGRGSQEADEARNSDIRARDRGRVGLQSHMQLSLGMEKGRKHKNVELQPCQSTLAVSNSKVVGGARDRVEKQKGKRRKIYRVKAKSLWFPSKLKRVRLVENKRGTLRNSEESSSSDSVLGHGDGPFLFKGECSKAIVSASLPDKSPVVADSDPIAAHELNKKGGLADGENGVSCQKDQSQQQSQLNRDYSSQDIESFVEETPEFREALSNQRREAVKGIDLCVDLRVQEKNVSSEGSLSNGDERETVHGCRRVNLLKKGRQGRDVNSVQKSHPMKTRRETITPADSARRHTKKKNLSWNLTAEIKRVIKRGTELGVDFNSKFACNRLDDGSYWDFEEEVTKVIETGAALGIDFGGREKEIRDIVSSREREEVEAYNV